MKDLSIFNKILITFKNTFNVSPRLKYDSKENIKKNNHDFNINDSAGGCFDTKTKTTYIFSDTIEKIRKRNYKNKLNEYDNGLTFLILSTFHELEHFVQRECPEKLKNQFKFSKQMYAVENIIINMKRIDPSIICIDYKNKHDNFLLEIDADIKGTNNAKGFCKFYNIKTVNERYLDLMKVYNEYRINNYDIPFFINQFIKIIKKYPIILNDSNWLKCDELKQFFYEDGTIKSIGELMKINSYMTPYFVSSVDFLAEIEYSKIDINQIDFIINCLNKVIKEHDIKTIKLRSFVSIEYVISELKKYTEVNGNNSKTSQYMANEKYYKYIKTIKNSLEETKKSLSNGNKKHL